MKRCALLILLFACSTAWCFSQKTVKVSAAYTYYAPETMSVEEAKRVALERAKIQAIADEFGTVVSQSTSTVVTNENGKSDTRFFSTGGSDVKGEWIETIGEPEYDIEFKDHFLVVACTIKGKAREITQAKIDFVAKTLRNGTTLKYESTEFRDGDDMYLYFQSPINGYLSVYLLDETTQTVYNILPYKTQKETSYPIIAGKEYILFSREEAEKSERPFIDEYMLTCDNSKEFNTLYFLFSPSIIGKRNGFDNSDESRPNNIPYNEFKSWISKTLSRENRIQLQKKNISLSNIK